VDPLDVDQWLEILYHPLVALFAPVLIDAQHVWLDGLHDPLKHRLTQ
jgi:hypothetical protein